MATGNYGIVRPADVNPSDIDIFYTYRSSRSTLGSTQATRISNSNISKITFNGDSLGGLYNMVLPRDIFNQRGIYNIFFRPKEIRTTVYDCGTLNALPNIKGLILDRNDPSLATILDRLGNGGLVGHRIEYLDSNRTKIPNLFRMIVSANICEPITDNQVSTSQKNIRYRFTETGSLLFLTVSPSSASSLRPNTRPFIGVAGGTICLYNTFFNPFSIEVEITDATLEAISAMLFGNVTIGADGIKTIYEPGTNEIFRQYRDYVIKDAEDVNELYRVIEELPSPDLSKDFDTIRTFDNQ